MNILKKNKTVQNLKSKNKKLEDNYFDLDFKKETSRKRF